MSGISLPAAIVGSDCLYCPSPASPILSYYKVILTGLKKKSDDDFNLDFELYVEQDDTYPCYFTNTGPDESYYGQWWYARKVLPAEESRLILTIADEYNCFFSNITSQCLNYQEYTNVYTWNSPSPDGYYGGSAIVQEP